MRDSQYIIHHITFGNIKIAFETVLKSEDIIVHGANAVKDLGFCCILKEKGAMKENTRGMTYSEIGSFFWLDKSTTKDTAQLPTWLPDVSDSAFTFSGRASIKIALCDILSTRKVNKVYAPSYCCISMLQTFIDQGLKIQYYDVTFEDGAFHYDIDYNHDCDIVLIMNYFGIGVEQTHKVIEKLHNGKAVIIEDITHSLLSRKVYSPHSDYLIASLRKWFAIPTGGWVGVKNGELSIKPNIDSDHAVDEKIRGMREKYEYLTERISVKENYLALQNKFELDLLHNERLLKIDSTSFGILKEIDVKEIIDIRRNNVSIFLNGLKDVTGLEEKILKCSEFNPDEDTPLFFPIFLNKEERESLRQYLINNRIYCPVHWPEIQGAAVGIRENELSIICDQRYSEGDMCMIVEVIRKWYMDIFKGGGRY